MNPTRAGRVAQMMQQELGHMIQTELKDPRIGFVSVTRVEVSRDLSVAKVFVSIMGTKEQTEASLQGLASAAAFLRGEVGRRLSLRHAPQLQFRQDGSITQSLDIQRIMKDLDTEHRGN